MVGPYKEAAIKQLTDIQRLALSVATTVILDGLDMGGTVFALNGPDLNDLISVHPLLEGYLDETMMRALHVCAIMVTQRIVYPRANIPVVHSLAEGYTLAMVVRGCRFWLSYFEPADQDIDAVAETWFPPEAPFRLFRAAVEEIGQSDAVSQLEAALIRGDWFRPLTPHSWVHPYVRALGLA